MMRSVSKFQMHRVIDKKLIEKAGIVVSRCALSYSVDGEESDIGLSSNSEEYILEIPGPDSNWDWESNDIIIRCVCRVENPKALFKNKDGIAFADAILGIGVVLASYESSQRYAVDFKGSIGSEDDGPIELLFEYTIPVKQLRGSFVLRPIIYLKKSPSVAAPDYYDCREGSMLGQVAPETFVHIQNQSPEFPTYSASDGRKSPLWKLETNWKDPMTDSFIESVCLILNSNHKDYSLLKVGRLEKNSSLLTEIYASALLQIMQKVKDEVDSKSWADIVSSNSEVVVPGSVSDYIGYMMSQRLKTDGSDIVFLSERLRLIIREGMV